MQHVKTFELIIPVWPLRLGVKNTPQITVGIDELSENQISQLCNSLREHCQKLVAEVHPAGPKIEPDTDGAKEDTSYRPASPEPV